MKVLMTGMSKTQTQPIIDEPGGYTTNALALHRALTTAGHEVDWSQVVPGADVRGYDAIVAGLFSPAALTARSLLGALWAIAQPVPHAFFIEDCRSTELRSNFTYFHGKPEMMWRATRGGKTNSPSPYYHLDLATERRAVIDAVMNYLATEVWQEQVLVPFFGWGDRRRWNEMFPNIARPAAYDPSPYAHPHAIEPIAPDRREKQWVLGALLDHADWTERLHLSWQIRNFGNKRAGHARLHERDLVREYSRSWGVLSPPYRHAGSGWWRARFVYAVRTGSVLLAAPREVEPIGGTYLAVAREPWLVESASGDDLACIAAEQRDDLLRSQWSEDRLVAWADSTLKEIAAQAPREIVPWCEIEPLILSPDRVEEATQRVRRRKSAPHVAGQAGEEVAA